MSRYPQNSTSTSPNYVYRRNSRFLPQITWIMEINSRYNLDGLSRGKRCNPLLGIKNHEIAFGYYKRNNLKNIYARIMVRVYDTSSERALQMYEV